MHRLNDTEYRLVEECYFSSGFIIKFNYELNMCSWVAQTMILGMLALCAVTGCPAFVEISDPPEQDSRWYLSQLSVSQCANMRFISYAEVRRPL